MFFLFRKKHPQTRFEPGTPTANPEHTRSRPLGYGPALDPTISNLIHLSALAACNVIDLSVCALGDRIKALLLGPRHVNQKTAKIYYTKCKS